MDVLSKLDIVQPASPIANFFLMAIVLQRKVPPAQKAFCPRTIMINDTPERVDRTPPAAMKVFSLSLMNL